MKRATLVLSITLLAAPVFAQTNVGGPIWYTPTNKVGINTSTPTNRLEVQGSNGAEGLSFINLNPLGVALVAFAEAGGGSTPAWIARQGSSSATNPRSMEVWNADNGLMRFATNNVERFRITAAGAFLIGTTTPSGALLDIAGDVNVTGNIAAKYQDIAEWVPSEHTLEGGTVVVLSTETINSVLPSTMSYDTKVAGVVSDRPGVLLGEGSAEKSKIATTGRVKVKVDASHHAVKIGDLLVTSDTPGYAMHSEPVDVAGIAMHRPGTIIGKALEPLASGRGEILVLLTIH